MSIAPSSPFDIAAQISASVQRMTMPPIPPINPGTLPDVPAPSTTTTPGTWWCTTFPNSILCKGGITTPGAPGGSPSGPIPGPGVVCSIPLIGKFACDLGQRAAFTVLAIFLIVIGTYVLIGGGATIVAPELREAQLAKGFLRVRVPTGRAEGASRGKVVPMKRRKSA